MAGDWIKMRVWLARDPKVIWMADHIASERGFMDWLTDPVQQACKESAYEHVTRHVTVALCVTALLVTWGTAREQGDRDGDDLVLRPCDLHTLDAMTDLPGFGKALALVGWAKETDDGGVVFPKFFRDNESPDDRHRRQAAERQARKRERERINHVTEPAKDHATSHADSHVTVTHREEKRREEVTTKDKGARAPAFAPPTLAEVAAYCSERGGSVDPLAWMNYYTANGWRVGKNPMKDWRAAVRTWETNRASSPQRPAKFNPAAASRELAARSAEEGDGQVIPAVAGFLRA